MHAFVENAAVLTALALAHLVLSPSLTRLTPLVAGGVFFDARAKVRFCDFGEAPRRWTARSGWSPGTRAAMNPGFASAPERG